MARQLITPNIPNVKTLPPTREGLVRVFFKDVNQYLEITPRFFKAYSKEGIIRHTNHYGWMCMEDKKSRVKRN